MSGQRKNTQRQLATLISVVGWLRRMGVPIWVMIPVGLVLLLGLLFRPAIEEQLGIDLGLPERPAVEASGDAPAATGNPSSSERTPTLESVESEVASYFTEVRPRVFESPAGLRYRPGSQQGHRMRHVMAHASDQPKRAGPHGVFDANEPLAVFQLIDEAYELAQSGRDTQVRREEGRTKYTVNLRRRIGFVGGQSGNADGRPPARRVRIILDGVNVITAYPVR